MAAGIRAEARRRARSGWARLSDMTVKASSSLDSELVRSFPLYKFVVDMKDLT